ncbi:MULTISPECIES: class I SAM-dependent methyltransferase [Mycolicibacterium]|uniref:Type 11 methyltransferase n=1 Tax=Mycolicibacterium senegalense TaxID=1796 RepID=A0A378WG36_9MYCO|nr:MULTISPECIES: methyltransferase domain-containing protein [Mycolicibacterium]MCV7337901.1 methyltransferase domain-containing protein [Mycolicibacterium senegalense]MDR7291288.1 SAM-dependent methyltransferase [Mycolicibacterium senegalense]QZA22790.1 methyltransferase domain-containing protein [Mycolicibacterium senegalense]CDP83970.1 methyltransferase type 11 [Mycolicibacterium farcinogenes]SUA32241.1 type 11 methyltransferase [Mycolicibacterium senegalense]
MNVTTTDRELEAKHRALWALGDYAAIAANIVRPLGPVLVEASDVGPGDRVLDVAAGTGNVAIPAAAAGARVTASDLCPELVEQGRRLTAEAGMAIDWAEANAEALPYDDGSFDTVLSCIGVMFAPHHQQAADELLRVTRRGGRIGLISWTPEGFIGQLFATMKPYVPAPPPGVSPPPLWGNEEHVRTLLENGVRYVHCERRQLNVTAYPDGAAFRDHFKSAYGPTISAYRAIAADADRVAQLDAEIAALGDKFLTGTTMPWEYLLTVANRY